MKCTTCAHPQRHAIDQALLAGDATFEALSRQYGPSISALFRHRKHLEAKTRRARARLRDNLSLGFFCKLNNFLAQIQNAAQTADAEGNAAVVLKAATAGTRIITSLAKQELPLELDMVYRFLASPQWATQDSLLPTDPQLLTDSHRAIAAGLFFPCPELTLPDLDAADADGSAEAAAEPDDRAAKAGVAEELSRLLSRLDLDPTLASPSILATPGSKLETSPAANRQKAAENHSRIKREKSAKLPRKSRPLRDDIKQYQYDNISAKISAKNRCVGRDPQGGASQSEAPPANHLESYAASPAITPPAVLPVNSNPVPPAPAPDPFLQAFPFLRPTLNPAIDREKSAKLPRNSRCSIDNNEQYQEYKASEKTSAKNPCVGRDPQGGASQSEAPPADQMESNAAPATLPPSCALPAPSSPEPLAKIGPPPPATLAAKLKTFFRPRPQPVSTQNCPPKTPNRLLPNPIAGLRSWFKQRTTKRPPDPPPVVYEPGWNIVPIQTERYRRGIY